MAGFDITVDFLDMLEQHVEDISVATAEASQIAKDHLYDEVQRRAAESPQWIGAADNIDTWDESDHFWIGVRSPQFVSIAFAAEYGTEEFPPEPILRTLDDATRSAAAKASIHLNARLGSRYT